MLRIWLLPFTLTLTKRRAEAIKTDEEYISHYGVKRRSGRYPWGSGERPYQSDPQKAKLHRKYEKTESDSWKKVARMTEKGKSQEKIGDYSWRQSNKLDDIQRKLNRLEHREIAESLGIADKKLQNAVADYEWAKKTAAKYEAEGKSGSKFDSDKLQRDTTIWSIATGPLMGAYIVSMANQMYGNETYVLKGAEYYENVAKKCEVIFKKKLPNADPNKLKMLEDKKG